MICYLGAILLYHVFVFEKCFSCIHYISAPAIPKNVSTGLTQSPDTISVSWVPPARGVAPLTQYYINIACISKVDKQILPNNVRFGKVEDITTIGRFKQRSVSVSKLFPYSTCSVEIREGAGLRPKWGKYSSPVQIFIPESGLLISVHLFSFLFM